LRRYTKAAAAAAAAALADLAMLDPAVAPLYLSPLN
jgi:hypothetical protein